jgi:formate/nitrite transporter FocA (FNT family)
VFPIAAFVAIGLEHSIANMVFLPWDLAVHGADQAAVVATLANLAVVTLGNIAGGTLLVAGIYWSIYLRRSPRTAA